MFSARANRCSRKRKAFFIWTRWLAISRHVLSVGDRTRYCTLLYFLVCLNVRFGQECLKPQRSWSLVSLSSTASSFKSSKMSYSINLTLSSSVANIVKSFAKSKRRRQLFQSYLLQSNKIIMKILLNYQNKTNRYSIQWPTMPDICAITQPLPPVYPLLDFYSLWAWIISCWMNRNRRQYSMQLSDLILKLFDSS